MSKSLGEKLFDAMLDVSGETDLWAGIGAFEQSQTERIALAFCAALSHDETATATIEALKAERDSLLNEAREAAELDALTRAQLTIVQDENDSLLAALKPFANLYDARGATHLDEDFRPVKVDRPDEQHAWGFNTADITWGDLRRAAALTTTGGKAGT